MSALRLAISFLLSALLAVGASTTLAAPPPGDPAAGKHICLDPGHGGSDAGAVNAAFGLQEKDVNLDESLYLSRLWERRGATVSMTRKDDDTLSTNGRYTFCNNARADILVSVHTNSVSDLTVDGTLTYYFHADDKVLATALYDAMWPHLDPGWAFTGLGVQRGAYGVLLKSRMPAAIVEPVFMSQADEAALLQTAIGSGGCRGCRRQQIADAIAAGVDAYFSR